jgi:hypothetical protein
MADEYDGAARVLVGDDPEGGAHPTHDLVAGLTVGDPRA